MDTDPGRHEHDMARWNLAGSLGVVLGPLLLSGLAFAGFGWRGVFLALAGLSVLVLVFAWRRLPKTPAGLQALPRFRDVWNGLRTALGLFEKARRCAGWCCCHSPT